MTNIRGIPLKIDGVSRVFTSAPVLHDLHLEVQPGEFIAVVGRSGSGKTTLLKILSGLDRPDQGKITVDNVPVDGPHPKVRIMFQDGRLLPWLRVGANVALGAQHPDAEATRNLLGRVGLADRVNDWPATLSGGQRQRVALARALVADPELLLLDEPLGSLDALTRIEMQRLIEALWVERRFTALLITHDVEEAVTLADRVLLLEGGRFVREWQVALPRPRLPSNSRVGELVEQILGRILNAPTSGVSAEVAESSLNLNLATSPV